MRLRLLSTIALAVAVAAEWTQEEKLEKLVPNPPKVTLRKVIAHETKAPALV